MRMSESTKKWWQMKAAFKPLDSCHEEEQLDLVSSKREKTKTLYARNGWNLYTINKNVLSNLPPTSHDPDCLYCAKQSRQSLPPLN